MNNPLIYLLDDDETFTIILERRFEVYGCQVRSFNKSEIFIQALQKRKANLILVDLNLEDDLSGFDIIKKIRNDYKLETPIIIISGSRDQKNMIHALEIGGNDYIVKPPLAYDFEETISQYIKSENLSRLDLGSYIPINSHKGKSKISFQVSIEEIGYESITLLSDHLIKKGTDFYLSGAELSDLIPGCDKILIRVVNSSVKIISNVKKFQIQCEIDNSQLKELELIRDFLNSKWLGCIGN